MDVCLGAIMNPGSHRTRRWEGNATMMTTRRAFLAGSAAALAASYAPAWGQAAPPTRVKVIDVHSHWYPPEWLELVEKEATDNGATKIERNSRGFMVISIPGLGVTF